jgi:small subunit ribosomal protein S1
LRFNKDAKRIILSHSRIHEDAKRAEKSRKRTVAAPSVDAPAKKTAPKRAKKEETVSATPAAEKTTLGDIQSLSDLKDKMDQAAEKAAKKEKKAKAAPAATETPVETAEAETAEA